MIPHWDVGMPRSCRSWSVGATYELTQAIAAESFSWAVLHRSEKNWAKVLSLLSRATSCNSVYGLP